MDPMENLVRDVLREHASDAPTVVPEVRAHRRTTTVAGEPAPPPQRWSCFAASLVAAARRRQRRRKPRAARDRHDGPTPRRASTHAAPGYRTVAYHEFTVDVPDDLPVLTVPCMLPDRYVLAENPNMPVRLRRRATPAHRP